MEAPPLCEFCCGQRALVYCKADAAPLCLPCDGVVHSANALSRRHPRALLCDRCLAVPAALRCPDLCLSLCRSCASASRRLLPLASYSGPAAPADLSCLWSPPAAADPNSTVTIPPVDLPSSPEEGLAGIVDPWIAAAAASSSSFLVPDAAELQDFLQSQSDPPKVNCSRSMDPPGVCNNDHDVLYNCPSNGDIGGFTIEDNGEMIGYFQSAAGHLYQGARLEGILSEKNISPADSCGHLENALEVALFRTSTVCQRSSFC